VAHGHTGKFVWRAVTEGRDGTRTHWAHHDDAPAQRTRSCPEDGSGDVGTFNLPAAGRTHSSSAVRVRGQGSMAWTATILLTCFGLAMLAAAGAHQAPRLCLHESCTRRRAYGFPALAANSSAGSPHRIAPGVRQYCAQHKLAGQVNLMTRLCTAGGCTRAASFGAPAPQDNGRDVSPQARTSAPLMRCATHRRDGDVDLRR